MKSSSYTTDDQSLDNQIPSIDDQSLDNQPPSTDNLPPEGIGGHSHADEKISLILGIAVMGGLGALIYALVFRSNAGHK